MQAGDGAQTLFAQRQRLGQLQLAQVTLGDVAHVDHVAEQCRTMAGGTLDGAQTHLVVARRAGQGQRPVVLTGVLEQQRLQVRTEHRPLLQLTPLPALLQPGQLQRRRVGLDHPPAGVDHQHRIEQGFEQQMPGHRQQVEQTHAHDQP